MHPNEKGELLPGASTTAMSLVGAVKGGDLAHLDRLLADHPGLAAARIGSRDEGTRSALHVATDWPGYFPNAPEAVRRLIRAGADPNARTTGRGQQIPLGQEITGSGQETPLHWAASSDDAEVAATLIEGQADLEAPHGSIGTPLANAVGYGCWNVAHLLVARGARVELLWQTSALGMLADLRGLLEAEPTPDHNQVSQAFWHACDGGQRRAAEYLLGQGADPLWSPDYGGTALDAAAGLGTQQENVVEWLQSLGIASSQGPDGPPGIP
jgi:ankyrin repeat protein